MNLNKVETITAYLFTELSHSSLMTSLDQHGDVTRPAAGVVLPHVDILRP